MEPTSPKILRRSEASHERLKKELHQRVSELYLQRFGKELQATPENFAKQEGEEWVAITCGPFHLIPTPVGPLLRFFQPEDRLGRGTFRTACFTIWVKEGTPLPYCELLSRKHWWPTSYREETLAKKLDHPNIMKPSDLCFWSLHSGTECFSQLQPLALGDLSQAISKEGLVENFYPALRIGALKQLLDVIAYFAKQSLIWTDLKPANILLLDWNPTIKIIDIGEIKEEGAKVTDQDVGSHRYTDTRTLSKKGSFGLEQMIYAFLMTAEDLLKPQHANFYGQANLPLEQRPSLENLAEQLKEL
ncbi:MAG: hypothetical protein AB7F31_03775 [Parachlamydiales bacterium]